MSKSYWRVVKLGSIASQRTEKIDPKSVQGKRYVALEHMVSGDTRSILYGTADDAVSTKTRFEMGDILYGKLRPYLDKAVKAPFDGICSTDIIPIVASKEVDSEYLLQIIHSTEFIRHATATSAGTRMPRTAWKEIAEFEFNLPPLHEQRRIAETLSTVDEAVAKTDQIIAQTETVKKGLMQRLLTKGIGHTRFKQTEIGKIPEGWRVVTLRDVVKLVSGKAKVKASLHDFSPEYSVPVYGGNGITGYTDTPLVDRPTIVIGRVGQYCGSIHLTKVPAWITDNALYTKWISDEVDIDFMALLLQYKDIGRLRSQSGQPLVSQEPIYNLLVSIPDLDEQKKIAQIIGSTVSKIDIENAKKHALLRIKHGLSEQMLSGKIRVLVG